ncbi:hypothetical protein V3N99_08430 [Dermatophilaceae bacterium Soc4.6]
MKATWTGAVLGAVLLAGCTAGGATDPTGPTSPSASPAPPSSTTTTATPTTSPQDAATASAEEVLRAYYRAQTTCFEDLATAPLTCFDPVAIGTELTNMRNAIASAKQMETKISGEIGLISVKRKSVDLTNKVNQSPPIVPTVVFTVCTDVTAYNIVDKAGKSIVPPGRQPHVLVDVSVYNYKLPDSTQWRVGYVVPVKGGTC